MEDLMQKEKDKKTEEPDVHHTRFVKPEATDSSERQPSPLSCTFDDACCSWMSTAHVFRLSNSAPTDCNQGLQCSHNKPRDLLLAYRRDH